MRSQSDNQVVIIYPEVCISISHRIHVCYINGNIDPISTPNVSVYTIHGSYIYICELWPFSDSLFPPHFFRWALLSADRCISSCLSVVPSVRGILEKHGVQHPKTDHTCSIMLQDGKSHQKYGWFILVASTDDWYGHLGSTQKPVVAPS